MISNTNVQQTIIRNNIEFRIPLGYKTLEEFAKVCRENLKKSRENPQFHQYISSYEKLVEKLEAAGV